jgi:predicted metal-dependent phosphoesterase TrpH
VELIVRAKKRGVNAICITDHDSYKGIEETQKIGRKEGIVVIPGIELTTSMGHILVYGVNVYEIFKIKTIDITNRIKLKNYVSFEELKDIFYIFASSITSKIDDLIYKVHEHGGVVALPHPFGRSSERETTVRYYLHKLFGLKPNAEIKMEELLSFIREQDPTYYSLLKQIDGVEVLNPLCSWLENYFASMLADSLGKNRLGGSDCHILQQVGICVTEFPSQIKSEKDFILQLKSRKTTPKFNFTEDELSILG